MQPVFKYIIGITIFQILFICVLYIQGYLTFESVQQTMQTWHQSPNEQKVLDPNFDLIMNDDLLQNTYPEQLKQIQKNTPLEKQSIMAQVIDENLFNKYKNHKTKTGQWTMARAINTGVMNPTSFVGIHAGDSESYEDYKEIFYPVIQKYHTGYNPYTDTHITDLNPQKITEQLSDLAKSKIFTTRIRVARNINTFPLNPAADEQNRIKVADLMENVFAGLQGEFKGQFYRHTTMSDEKRQELIDDHFLFRGKDKMQASSGYHQYWPIGRGIFINDAKTFLVWVNEGDHLRIISMQKGGDVLAVFTRLSQAINLIEQGLQQQLGIDKVFQSTPELGCITCCPSNLGTGLRASVHLNIPKLIENMGLEGINDLAQKSNCQARGSSGEHSKVVDRVDISNWRRLGFAENILIQDMIQTVNELVKLETNYENQQ